MKSMKRIITALLAFVLLLSLLPASAFAYEDTPDTCRYKNEHSLVKESPDRYVSIGHFTKTNTNATCTKNGGCTYTCNRCGYKVFVADSSKPAKGHTWGDWEVIQEEDGETPGVSSRSCTVCGETEQVEGFALTVQEGDTSIEVYILQALLTDNGTYSGSQDGVFSAELTAAVRLYQTANKLEPTGIAHGALFRMLTNELLTRENPATYDGYIKDWESGLTAYAVSTGNATSLNDGTHEVTYTLNGVRYLLGEERTFLGTSYAKEFPIGIEECHLANTAYTCDICGYVGEVPAFPAQALAFGSFALMNDPVDIEDLPPVEGLTLAQTNEIGGLRWDKFDGADSYECVVVRFNGDEETEVERCNIMDTFYLAYDTSANYTSGIFEGPIASYRFTIIALKDGEPISRETALCATLGNKLPNIENIQFSDSTLSWTTFTSLPDGCYFKVTGYDENGEDVGRREYITNVIDIQSLSGFYWYEGSSFSVTIQAVPGSAGDAYTAGNIATFNVENYERPLYYQVNYPCNVRSGPGTNYERMGGLSEGTIIRVYNVDEFLTFDYAGETGYVLASCCTVYSPHFWNVSFITISGEPSRTYPTRYDGTIDQSVFDELHSIYDGQYEGNLLAGWTQSSSETSTDFITTETVFTESRTVMGIWQADPNYVDITLYYNGAVHSYVKVKKGKRYINFLPAEINGNLVEWYNESGEKLKLTDMLPYDAPEYPVFTARTSTTTMLITCKDVPLYEHHHSSADILEIVRRGTEVTLVYYDEYGTYPYHVRLADGTEGNFAKDAFSSYDVTVSFDANGGWCDIAELHLTADTEYDNSALPIPSKEGCTFIGWRDYASGTLYRLGTTFELHSNRVFTACWENYSSTPMIYETNYFWRNPYRLTSRYLYVLYTDSDGVSHGYDTSGNIVSVPRNELTACFVSATPYCPYDVAYSYYGTHSAAYETLHFNSDGSYPYAFYLLDRRTKLAAYSQINTYSSRFAPNYLGKVVTISGFDAWATVTFDTMGGSIPASYHVMTFEQGSTINYLPTPTKSGCTFIGWYTDPTGGKRVNVGDALYWNTTLYAQYSGEAGGYYAIAKATYAFSDIGLDDHLFLVKKGTVVAGSMVYSEELGEEVLYACLNGNHYYFRADRVIPVTRMQACCTRRSKNIIYAEMYDHLAAFPKNETVTFYVVNEQWRYAGTAVPSWHCYRIAYCSDNNPDGFAYVDVDSLIWY